MPPDPTPQEFIEAYGQFKTTLAKIEEKGLDLKLAGELTERMNKIEPVLEAQETQNQKISEAEAEVKALKDAGDDLREALEGRDTKEAEVVERLGLLEAEMARKTASAASDPVGFKTADEYQALNAWMTDGHELAPEKKQLLRTDIATSGGVLVTTELETFITKQIVELDAFRPLARVRRIAGKAIELPVRTSIPSASWEGEAEAGGTSQSTYASETLTAFRNHIAVPITQDLLMDAAFDMESEVTEDASTAFALSEGTGFITGTGVKDPQGILSDSRVNSTDTEGSFGTLGARKTITGDDIMLLQGRLKTGYDGVLLFNRTTLSFLRTLRADSGEASTVGTGPYLWSPALDGGASNQLGGMAYRLMPSMPDVASGSKSVAVGDFRRGYTIVDRTGLSIIRDEVTLASQNVVKFTFNRYLTGKVTLPEAIEILTTAA